MSMIARKCPSCKREMTYSQMIKNKRTKILKEIRRQLRHAHDWIKSDDGMPDFWSSLNYRVAKKHRGLVLKKNEQHYHYYTRSNRAIEDIAIKIFESVSKEIIRENDKRRKVK